MVHGVGIELQSRAAVESGNRTRRGGISSPIGVEARFFAVHGQTHGTCITIGTHRTAAALNGVVGGFLKNWFSG